MKLGLTDARTALWFLKRPQLYPVFYRKLKKRLTGGGHHDTRKEAEAWCDALAIETDEAIERLTGIRPERPVREEYEDVFAGAERRVDACPEAMGGPGNVDLLYHLAEHIEARKVVETGVAYGWSSLAILLSLQHRRGSSLISTDMPQVLSEADPHTGCAVPEDLAEMWTIIRRADREALPIALRELGIIDLCHYDSDKTHEGRQWAYPRLWEVL